MEFEDDTPSWENALAELANAITGSDAPLAPLLFDETGAYSDFRARQLADDLANATELEANNNAERRLKHQIALSYFYCAIREATTTYEWTPTTGPSQFFGAAGEHNRALGNFSDLKTFAAAVDFAVLGATYEQDGEMLEDPIVRIPKFSLPQLYGGPALLYALLEREDPSLPLLDREGGLAEFKVREGYPKGITSAEYDEQQRQDQETLDEILELERQGEAPWLRESDDEWTEYLQEIDFRERVSLRARMAAASEYVQHFRRLIELFPSVYGNSGHWTVDDFARDVDRLLTNYLSAHRPKALDDPHVLDETAVLIRDLTRTIKNLQGRDGGDPR